MKYLQKEDIYGGLSLEKKWDICLWTGFSEIGKTLKPPPQKKNIKVIVNTIHKQVDGRDTWHRRVNKV